MAFGSGSTAVPRRSMLHVGPGASSHETGQAQERPYGMKNGTAVAGRPVADLLVVTRQAAALSSLVHRRDKPPTCSELPLVRGTPAQEQHVAVSDGQERFDA